MISGIPQIVMYDRMTKKIEGIKNPSGTSKYFGIKVQVGLNGSATHLWLRDNQSIAALDLVTKKCFKIITTNNQSEPISDFYLDVAAFDDSSRYPSQAARVVALYTIEHL